MVFHNCLKMSKGLLAIIVGILYKETILMKVDVKYTKIMSLLQSSLALL